ncbi:FK506-binding protein 1 [Rozella allomycis CSF55]|uniref:peptidylprolyl isomerase n=1 Tax=Rozella allomycis (strain CSF55) TaxID=988480 RepID=A0A075ATF8_ROZAC|nr:FK506-binding protein 1 [Rozella allomycis CSF55]RKP20378.1 FK506-binding protein 1 [Rozella allomycis CSF55]|eukprot:EPZ33455.1 FK506-binding protein 1 [Rozella allomycis CSF55]
MGVQKETTKAGDGKNFPKKDDGYFENGQKFDSSRDRNKPFKTTIGVGQVIRGWDEGVPQMSLGECAKLKISYDYGYGERGYPGVIPPKSNLIFDVELLQIN